MKPATQTVIDRKLQNAMTVAELIEALGEQDPDAKVVFACDYGDYGHTEQALPVTVASSLESNEGDEAVIAESAYSHSGLSIEAVEEDEDDDGDEPEAKADAIEQPSVVILR